MDFNLVELDRTVTRLREQLRKLEMETEAQILFKHQQDDAHRADFDPLELDRYSAIQQLSRALAESVSDVGSIEGLLENLNRDTQNLLQQQGRIVTELQNGLMRTRMVPFQRHVQRLTRLLRQVATETGKKAELVVEGASGELDRQVLERMLPPFEHMLRNAVVHGIEIAGGARWRAASRRPAPSPCGLQREGAEVVIVVEDDGAGLNVAAIRAKARQMGLLRPEQNLTDEEALQLVLEPGFSTADRLTQQAGRGVGMDVVATEVKKLGGGLFIESNPGYGARFTIRLPFTLAITQALIVRVHDEFFALPVATVEGVARLPRNEIERHLAEEQPTFEYGGHDLSLPAPGQLRRCGAVRAARDGHRAVGDPGPRRRTFDGPRGGRTRRQPRDRGQVGRSADRRYSRHFRRDDPRRRPHRRSFSTWARWCAPNGVRARPRACARRATIASLRSWSTIRSRCAA